MQVFRCLLVITFLPFFCLAKPLVLATFPIPLMVESSDQGLFINLTKEISRRIQRPVQIVVAPTGKTLVSFANNQVDGMFPGLDVYMAKESAKSEPFYYKVDYVFYRKDHPLKTIKDLEGKKVGLTFRYPYAQELVKNKKIQFEFAEDDVANMKKLGRKVIDAFVVEERSGLKALQLSEQKDIFFDKAMPLSNQKVYYAFQDSEEGRRLAEAFSKAIKSMAKDGTLHRLLEESAP